MDLEAVSGGAAEGLVDGDHFGLLVYLAASERRGVQWSAPGRGGHQGKHSGGVQ